MEEYAFIDPDDPDARSETYRPGDPFMVIRDFLSWLIETDGIVLYREPDDPYPRVLTIETITHLLNTYRDYLEH
jgi:hypothetical protein